VISAQGFDPIWFGIFAVMVTELSLITPPVGLNLFVIKGVVQDIGVGTLYRGILPFIVADVIRILLLILIPSMALWLPTLAAQ
jgi:TRAP-type C4-dicarboxylate transport system permease large subunit